MAGKGDTPRAVNKTKYNENFANIKWSSSAEKTAREVKKVKNKTVYKY